MSITVQQVTDAKAHIGTLKSEAHPKTNKYWTDVVNGIVIVNPEIIAGQLESARKKIQEAKSQWKDILIVCEKKMYADNLAKLWQEYGFNYLNYKVPSWFLTNFDTLRKRIESMNSMARFVETDDYHSLTKKEQLIYKRKLDRVHKIYKWVKDLSKRPDLVVVVDWGMMKNFINEIEKKDNIEGIIIAWTNFDRRWEDDNLIIWNIWSYRSIDFILKSILS